MAIITLPVVKMLLVAIMLLGLLVEIKTGGMGAGVLLGIVAAGARRHHLCDDREEAAVEQALGEIRAA